MWSETEAAPPQAWRRSHLGAQQPAAWQPHQRAAWPLSAAQSTTEVGRAHEVSGPHGPHVLLDLPSLEESAAWREDHAFPLPEADDTARSSHANPAEQLHNQAHASVPIQSLDSKPHERGHESLWLPQSSSSRQPVPMHSDFSSSMSSPGKLPPSLSPGGGQDEHRKQKSSSAVASPATSRPGSARSNLQGTDSRALLQRGIRMQWNKPSRSDKTSNG